MCSLDILSTPSEWAFFGKIQNFSPPAESSDTISEDMMDILENSLQKLLSEDQELDDTPKKGTNSTSPWLAKREKRYLEELLKEKQSLIKEAKNSSESLENEISRVWEYLNEKELRFANSDKGNIVKKTEIIYVPANARCDFVGRLLGPRGQTVKELSKECGCSIYIRGKGSMKDKMKEEKLKNLPKWKHLNEELHVAIECDDTEQRSRRKLARAVGKVKKLMLPEIDDKVKEKQLMDLAILNGTYEHRPPRTVSSKKGASESSNHGLSPVTFRFVDESNGKISPVTLRFVE